MGKSEKSTPSDAERPEELETLHFGVYRVLVEKKTSSFFKPDFNAIHKKWTASAKVFLRFAKEAFGIAPALFTLYLIGQILHSVEYVILLVFETQILRNIEDGLLKGGLDARATLQAVISRVGWVVFSALFAQWNLTIQQSLKTKVINHFDDYILKSRLNTDLPTLDANLSDAHITATAAWYFSDRLMGLVSQLVSITSELALILHLARSNEHGMIFAALCVAKPLLQSLLDKSLWLIPHVVEATNQDYLRMRALKHLAEKQFRLDVISGDIAQYIVQEFRKAREKLGDISFDSAETQHHMKRPLRRTTIVAAAGDLPMMYCVAIAFFRPYKISLAMIASLQESSALLRWSFRDLSYQVDEVRQRVSFMEQLYNLETKSSVIKDGDLPYPPPNDLETVRGMDIELRDVSFTYPGSKSKTKALSDVSFRIKAGQLVVVVGANGCGKSTFMKLLMRLYDADSGTVLIDGHDIREYNMAGLRQAMATLTQDHHLFPLSIAENVGLGFCDGMDNEDMIQEAAKKGGADEVIGKLSQGMQTVLEPRSLQYGVHVVPSDDTPLSKELRALEKSADVSGGERQRLVASRTFMRFNSGKIRFVAVDEPSSALDPEAELQLFNNLREARSGKTMIFVTHRFGHLTKHADQIICMKSGQVVEVGTHQALMALGASGEYSKMYNIQAHAFEKEVLNVEDS